MSLKGLFDTVAITKIVDNKTSAEIGRVVESADYHEADIIDEKRFVPSLDFSDPKNFAKYGSAEKYYEDSYSYIYSSYPYDGSLAEKLQWKNSGSYIDLYIFENKYPRTTGYINFSYGGWGSHGSSPKSGNAWYGTPQTSDLEYISLNGGPGLGGGIQDQSANVWDNANNRESNLEIDPTEGVTVEFWLKKDAFTSSNTEKEVIIDLWNNELSSSDSYGRLRLELTSASGVASNWLVTMMSGTTGVQWQTLGNTPVATVTDGSWHHYAFSFLSASNGLTAKSYTDGSLQTEETLGSTGINKIGGVMQAYLGGLITSVSGNTYHGVSMTGSGKLSASMDEFRYWKTQRSSEKIGRYWFTQVGGGTNTDLANTDLGVYYKFNEGITQTSSIDSIVLDFSGRVTNGSWTGYSQGARNTGSAMVSASATTTEFRDPIVYPTHPDVVSTLAILKASGSVHDTENSSEFFGFLPSWMQEQDSITGNDLKKLTQIISSYLDTLYLQIESFGRIHDIEYLSGSASRANTVAEKLLASKGLLAPELFLDADILEKLGDRSETRVYQDSLTNVKNKIYQNIYNNLANIYKTKGTRKSFRNLLRCFGVDRKIYRLNVYGNNVQYKIRNNRELYSARKHYADFNKSTQFESTIFLSSSGVADTVSYLSGGLSGGYASTLEAYVLFPTKPAAFEKSYETYRFNYLTSSLFGQHTVKKSDPDSLTWETTDATNFQVYAIRDEVGSKNAKFVLTSSAGGVITSPLTSSYYDDVYSTTNWIFGVTCKPSEYPLVNYIDGTTETDYVVEFKGTQVDAGEILNSFVVTSSLDLAVGDTRGFITGSKRIYVGAHRQDFEGTVLDRSDVRVGFCRYWLNDISLELMQDHGKDILNYGSQSPIRSPYLFQTDQQINAEFLEIDTLALNWDFETVTGSDSSGEFAVVDFSSGSSVKQATQFGALGNLLGAQHPGYGYDFPASSTDVVDIDYTLVSELQDFERLDSSDMIEILNTQDDIEFTRESRPINFTYAIEKSMYQTISENMVRMFGTIMDFNNIIGSPANRYRDTYKELRILRERFFEKVENTPDLDKYIEFYKWFDSSLSKILEQFIPAGAQFSKDVRNVIESHMLERSKYQHKFPTMDLKAADLAGNILSPLPLSPGWQFTHHPINDQENTNANWWKTRASRFTGKLSLADLPDVNSDKQIYFENSTGERLKRREKNIYRFRMDRKRDIRAGITTHENKIVNFVFDATAPYGPVVAGTNIPQNIMLSFNTDVEQFQDIVDDLEPGKKKRVGFGIDPTINVAAGKLKQDGNILAPFSLYSSSVANGYNSKVVDHYKSNILLTNLHEDIVYSDETRPLQGPFTEKFVGGRQYRHTELNSASYIPNYGGKPYFVLDTRFDRAEGFRVELGLLPISPGALGIVPPNYPFGTSPSGSAPSGFLPDLPTAQRLRDESAKRPVNIKNILMTTASVGVRLSGTLLHNKIGNYSKNYQIVQSNARTNNDLYFREQSFNFALYPETTATRGRFPLEPPEIHSVYFGGETTDDRILIGADSVWAAEIGGAGTNAKAFSLSAWVKVDATISDNDRIFDFSNSDRRLYWDTGGSGRFEFTVAGSSTTGKVSTSTITTGVWTHIVATFEGGNTGAQKLYVNGTLDTSLDATVSAPLEISGMECFIGARGTGTQDEWLGHICDAAVWRKELSQSDVTEIYNSGERFNLEQTIAAAGRNLISWWKLGDDVDDATDGSTSYSLGGNSMIDQMGAHNGTPESLPAGAIQKTSPNFANLTQNVGGNLEYTLPTRTGVNSNQTIFVNRFGAPGDYDSVSRGYLDPAHEEKSVYSVLPYRNLAVLNFGTIVSASLDTSISFTMHVVDESVEPGIDRGLRQRLVPHNEPFGYDGAYTAYPAYYKVNRNPRVRVTDSDGNEEKVYDNYFVHHPIPRTTRQYSWISASWDEANSTTSNARWGYAELSGGYFVSSLPLISSSDFQSYEYAGRYYYGKTLAALRSHCPTSCTALGTPFNGMNTNIREPVSASTNTLGFPIAASTRYYINIGNEGILSPPDYMYTVPGGLINVYYTTTGSTLTGDEGAEDGDTAAFNAIMLHRNGPYGWPSWKQIRTEEHPVVRNQKKNSILSMRTKTLADINIGARRGNALTQFIEPQVYSSEFPMIHEFNMGPALQTRGAAVPVTRLSLKSSYGNKLINFANYEINNLLGATKNYDSGDLYFNRINSMILEGQNNDEGLKLALSKIGATYAQTVYPATYNAFLERTRSRKYYSIADIWNDRRANRSVITVGHQVTNSQGNIIEVGDYAGPGGIPSGSAPSIWPLDAHSEYTTANGGWRQDDGAGELQNSYSRYKVATGFDAAKLTFANPVIKPAATYNARIPVGEAFSAVYSPPMYPGDSLFTAHAAVSSPYKTYEEYAKYLRLVGKDYSIVPEFRISEHIAEFLQSDDFATLADIDDLLDLTGSGYTNSSETGFYKEYGNSDFMKMFEVVNSTYSGAELLDGSKMSQDKIGLRCNALVQFLPYKGFYPAERTQELASLFSQSVAPSIFVSASSPNSAVKNAVWRAMLEPLYSQGIMYNTIKSGIAVSNFIISQTSSLASAVGPSHGGPTGSTISASAVLSNYVTPLPEGNIYFDWMLPPFRSTTGSSPTTDSYWQENGFYYQKIPFEALYKPRNYFSKQFISGSGRIYDTGLGSASLQNWKPSAGVTGDCNYLTWDGSGDKLYEFAIDNFLCETVNFFENGLTSILSNREENFGAAKKGEVYTMKLKLYRPTTVSPGYDWAPSGAIIPDHSKFDMYRRISAFGPPLGSRDWTSNFSAPNTSGSYTGSFSHLTPPYYAGSGSATFTFTATYDGAPTLDEIFAGTEITYDRMETIPLTNGKWSDTNLTDMSEYMVQMKDSFNLTSSISSVPEGSDTLKKQWLIQSKFETPVLHVSASQNAGLRAILSTSGSNGLPLVGTASQCSNIKVQGLWHQYAEIPSGDQGVFAIIESPPPREARSLAELVGMPIGEAFRIGQVKSRNLLEEAVVAVPFFVGKDDRRKFYRLDRRSGNSIKRVRSYLEKYVFPPRFDFVINKEMDPIAMYVFEFSRAIDQKDIANMWQNLPPSISETFEQKVAIIEHKLLRDQMLNKGNRKLRKDLRWLVFKVKKRAEMDFTRFTKKNLVDDLSLIPSNIGNSKYSYNWPYDYFSLVELVKIDEAIEYNSQLPPDSRVAIVGEVNIADEPVFEDLE